MSTAHHGTNVRNAPKQPKVICGVEKSILKKKKSPVIVMTAVTADYPGREETQDPLVCMTKSALHGNRRVAGGETAGSSSHCRQQSQQAAPIAGSCHCRQLPLQAATTAGRQEAPLQAATTAGSTHYRQLPYTQHPLQAAQLPSQAL